MRVKTSTNAAVAHRLFVKADVFCLRRCLMFNVVVFFFAHFHCIVKIKFVDYTKHLLLSFSYWN